jgi:hypothetical protein
MFGGERIRLPKGSGWVRAPLWWYTLRLDLGDLAGIAAPPAGL